MLTYKPTFFILYIQLIKKVYKNITHLCVFFYVYIVRVETKIV